MSYKLGDIFIIFAKNLKKIRLEKGLSIKELSKLSGIRASYLEKIEKAQATGMTTNHLISIAQALKVSSYKLFAEINQQE